MTSPVLNLNSLSIIFELFMLAFSLTTKSRKMNASCSISSTGILGFFKKKMEKILFGSAKKEEERGTVQWDRSHAQLKLGKEILHAEKGRALSILCNIYLHLKPCKPKDPALGLNGFCLSRHSH